jgi:hypothetical protein
MILTKVSIPNKYATSNIQNYIKKYPEQNFLIDKIQDNLNGYLLIKYKNGNIQMHNYYVNKFYSHNKIKICLGEKYIIKQIDSFDQNNWLVGNKLRNYVINLIKKNQYEYSINSILGIGGEYYLYWVFFPSIKNLIGISNNNTIINDAMLNIPWSSNYFVNYNNLKTYPVIIQTDLILINLSKINSNVIKYIIKINLKKIIIISCDLPDSKLKLLSDNFIIKKIKYFRNIDGLLRIIELVSKKLFNYIF